MSQSTQNRMGRNPFAKSQTRAESPSPAISPSLHLESGDTPTDQTASAADRLELWPALELPLKFFRTGIKTLLIARYLVSNGIR